jgi:hypothetical protein
MVNPSLVYYWLGLLCLPAAGLAVAYVLRGLNRGWFYRRDGVTRVKREASPAVFWFEVGASLALATALTLIGLFAAARLVGANT